MGNTKSKQKKENEKIDNNTLHILLYNPSKEESSQKENSDKLPYDI